MPRNFTLMTKYKSIWRYYEENTRTTKENFCLSIPIGGKIYDFPLIVLYPLHIIKVGKSLLSMFQKGGVKSCQQIHL